LQHAAGGDDQRQGHRLDHCPEARNVEGREDIDEEVSGEYSRPDAVAEQQDGHQRHAGRGPDGRRIAGRNSQKQGQTADKVIGDADGRDARDGLEHAYKAK